MGGFTNFFDRPAPRTTSLVKNQGLQNQIDPAITNNAQINASGQSALGDYITKYLANQGQFETANAQEQGAIGQFYNGGMNTQLAALRNQRAKAMTDAADRASAYAIRGVNQGRLGNEGGGSSYDTRQAIGKVTDIQTQAALDNANQERQDLGYVTGNQVGLAGARAGLMNQSAQYGLAPTGVARGLQSSNTQALGGLMSLDQGNKFYGIKQDPGILDRLRQEQQFVSGLGSLMKDQYSTAAEAYGGWAGAGMGGGGGGGGGGMGGMSMMGGMARGGMVRMNDYRGGGRVFGPGTETSDSVPANLSEGEFVVPAAAVKMPGVLPWLKQLRSRALNITNSVPDRVPGHYESGGLIYANDFGGLGSMAFNYDALNEKSQQTANAAGQQQDQFDAEQQYKKDKDILDRYQQGRRNPSGGQQAVGGGYTPESTTPDAGYLSDIGSFYSRGGLVRMSRPDRMAAHTLNSGYARGGLVRGYAGGGPVGGDSDAFHAMAIRAAYEMAQPDWQNYKGRELDIQSQREKDYGTRWDRQEKVNEQYLDLAKKQAEKGASDLTPVQAAAAARKESLLHSLASSFVQQGDVGGIQSIQGLDADTKSTYAALAARQNESLAALHNRAQQIAAAQNEKVRVDTLVPKLKENIDKGTHFYGDDSAMADWKSTYETHLARQKQLAASVGKLSKDELALTSPDENGNFTPVTRPPPAVGPTGRPVSYVSPSHEEDQYAPGYVPQQQPPATRLQPSSTYIPNRRYGNLRYMGGDPNVEASWQPIAQ